MSQPTTCPRCHAPVAQKDRHCGACRARVRGKPWFTWRALLIAVVASTIYGLVMAEEFASEKHRRRSNDVAAIRDVCGLVSHLEDIRAFHRDPNPRTTLRDQRWFDISFLGLDSSLDRALACFDSLEAPPRAYEVRAAELITTNDLEREGRIVLSRRGYSYSPGPETSREYWFLFELQRKSGGEWEYFPGWAEVVDHPHYSSRSSVVGLEVFIDETPPARLATWAQRRTTRMSGGPSWRYIPPIDVVGQEPPTPDPIQPQPEREALDAAPIPVGAPKR